MNTDEIIITDSTLEIKVHSKTNSTTCWVTDLDRGGEGRAGELDRNHVDADGHAVDHFVDEIVFCSSGEWRQGLVRGHGPQLLARLYIDVYFVQRLFVNKVRLGGLKHWCEYTR